ncbi:MAG: hypothetical protein H0U75_05940 [Legionella sp.]|nr:hypothetical protein [Legionella sp.]
MNNKLRNLSNSFIPFLIIGISIALFLCMLFIFAYVAIWGIIIGGMIWVATMIKKYFFPVDQPGPINKEPGRIIDHKK